MNPIYLPEGNLQYTPENREALSSPAAMERAMMNETVLEAVATLCDGDLRLHFDLPCAEGIMEPDECVLCREGEARKDIAVISRVGKPTAFCVRSIVNRDGRLIASLSRRRAQERCVKERLSALLPGDVIPARVTHLEPFGAFLDVGCGVSSLLSVDCVSVSRISHPRDRLRCGAEIRVAVKSIEPGTGRIYTTMRELLGTWEENAADFRAGQTVTGVIRSVESYGVFVELTPNLAGLAELRDFSPSELRERIGQSASVYVKSISPERMKIKLVLIDLTCAPPPQKPLRYFLPPDVTHLSAWSYSPPSCRKTVATVFDAPAVSE